MGRRASGTDARSKEFGALKFLMKSSHRCENKGRKMRIERRYTRDGQSPYADIAFRLTTSEIRNPDGSVVFRADAVEVPEAWSQVASDVLAQKYFRKAGVPAIC